MNAVGDERRLAQLTVSKAIGRMIVDHANGLHEGITNRRADEFEAPAFQVSTHGIGDRRMRGHVSGRFPAIADRPSFDESPDILVKAAGFLLNEKKGLRVCNGRLNFKPVPDDPGVVQQVPHFSFVVSGDDPRVKIIKSRSERVSFLQNRVPTQSGLRPFEDEKFE